MIGPKWVERSWLLQVCFLHGERVCGGYFNTVDVSIHAHTNPVMCVMEFVVWFVR